MRTLILIFVMLMLVAARRNGEYTTVGDCTVQFEIVNAGITVTGVVEDVVAQIDFDPGDINHSHIIAKAKPQSIRTGIQIRDKHLQRSDYFHSALFPEITLTSTVFRKVRKNNYMGTFKLTTKGVTKVIQVPFKVTKEDNVTIYSGIFEINRMDFGLGEESLILDNRVKIAITARAIQP